MTRVFLYPLSFLKGRLAKADRFFIAKIVLTAHYKYVYDGQGNIVRSIDILGQKEYNYEYEEEKLLRATECDISIDTNEFVVGKVVVNTIKYYYDTEGKMTKKVVTPASGSAQTIYYENSEDNTVVKFNAGGKTITAHSKTDSFGRKVFDELQLGTGFVSRQFHYHAGVATEEHVDNNMLKSSPTTQLVSQIVLSGGRTISYEYDEEERITKVVDTVDGTTEYTYDALGQLLTETKGDITTKFEYDNYGNIKTKNSIEYGYDTVWKDLLTSYNGQEIIYDKQGNPISYLGHTLTWEKGRQLKRFVKDNNIVIDYTYNANGIRTSKTVDGIRHDYILDGAKIIKETWGNNTLIPMYDNEDSVCGILYNNDPYYFQKNLQGDIIGIVDKDAEIVARYSYDAWGVPTIVLDSTTCLIATINPFRYRSYYFDEETGMYYLQSRYYDAKVGRFVNGDEVTFLGISKTNLGYNLFAYCENSLATRIDLNGNAWVKIVVGVVIVVAIVVLIGSTLHKAYKNNKYNYQRERTDIVYGQKSVNMKFANSTVSESGCGIIAAYNAIRLHRFAYLSEVVFYFDKRNSVTGNLWAAPFWDVAGCIKAFTGFKTKTKLFPKSYDTDIKNSAHKMGVVAYNLHYFLAKWDANIRKFVTYNRFNNDTATRKYTSIDNELKNKKHLCLVTF